MIKVFSFAVLWLFAMPSNDTCTLVHTITLDNCVRTELLDSTNGEDWMHTKGTPDDVTLG